MQGRRGQGYGPWDRSSGDEPHDDRSGLNGTGKHRSAPQRPPGMTRLAQPPATPRVARPQRQSPRPKRSLRRRLLIFSVILVAGVVLVAVIVYGLTNLLIGINTSAGAATTAADFLTNLKSANYDQAYTDLDATITVTLSHNEFTQLAQADDHCYGTITDFNEVSGSATVSADGNTQSFVYDVTRSKLSKPYQLHLTLQKDSNGDWDITGYGNDLGPAPPTCK
jgi:hypothetical protein